MNIIDYAERKMDSFKRAQFNPVDSLVLSQLTYIYFNHLVPGIKDPDKTVRIADLLKAEYIPDMLDNVRNPEDNYKLLLALGMSPRFRDITMCSYCDKLDIGQETQFAAVTYLLDDENAYIGYRGTDASFIGWKEDFNMAFISPIPAQEKGLEYLTQVAEKYPHILMLGGHSKGGNIAVYSAMECHPSIQKRIVKVYSHDGPGFKDEILIGEKYEKIKDRVYKSLPQSSLVGMLLHNQEDYTVVKSKQFWIMQHDPFSWQVDGEDFKYAKGITKGAEHVNVALSQWLSGLDDKERERFINTLYSVFESIGVVNFNELTGEWYKNTLTALSALRGIDKETKHFVFETLKALFSLYVRNIGNPLK